MSGKKSKNAVHFFVDYVKERNVSLMTKGNTAQAAVSLWFLIKSLLWIASRVGFYFSLTRIT